MIRKLLLIFAILLSSRSAIAQSYQWITGGGSTEGMSPSRNYERVTNMCTDDDGNIYITALTGATSILADTFSRSAYNTSPSIPHILLASYTCDGTMRWAKLIESAEGAAMGSMYYNGSMAYANGSIYITGDLYGNNKHIGPDTTITSTYLRAFTTRYDTLGHFKWIKFVGVDSSHNEFVTGFGDNSAIAIDGQGHIHDFNFVDSGAQLTSTLVSHTGTYDLKYDSSGNLLSANKLQMDTTWSLGKAIFNKQDGKFYALLGLNENYAITSVNTAICAFRPDETVLWMDTTSYQGQIFGFDYRGGNEIYACGYCEAFYDTMTFGGRSVTDTAFPIYNMALLYRLDTNGRAQWVYDLQSNGGIDWFRDVTILPGGKVGTTGEIFGISVHGHDTVVSTTGEYRNPVLLVVDTGGHTIKLDQLHGSGNDDDGTAIASDTVGNVYVGGLLDANMFPTGLSPYLSHGGNTDFFLAKYGVNCSCTSMPTASYTDTGSSFTIGFTYTGTSTGVDSVVWTYGDGNRGTGLTATHTYSVAGIYRVCVTVYTDCGSNEICRNVVAPGHAAGVTTPTPEGAFSLFPNPSGGEISIMNAQDCNLQIYDMMGQKVYESSLASNFETLNIGQLMTGVYLVEVESKDGARWVQRLVVAQ